MLQWLKTNSAAGKNNADDNKEALDKYRGIDDDQVRNNFISNFYKSRILLIKKQQSSKKV